MNSLYITIIFAIVFGMVMGAIGLGYRLLESQRKKQVGAMLTAVSGGEQTDSSQPTILMGQPQTGALESILDKGLYGRLNKLIQQAAMPWTVSRLISSMFISGAFGGFFGWLFLPLGFPFVGGLAGAAAFGLMPYLFLRIKRSRRMAEMEAQLPEALDFLARSMRAGHAFSISLEMLGGETPEPLGQEFRVLFNELNLGAPLEPALANLAGRVPLLDMQLFVSSVLLQRQTGGNLSEILLRLSHVIRERFQLKRHVQAVSAHGRMTAGVLTVMPIVLMLALLVVAPGYLQGMAADSTGKWMIWGSIGAQILGYYIIRKIVNIKV